MNDEISSTSGPHEPGTGTSSTSRIDERHARPAVPPQRPAWHTDATSTLDDSLLNLARHVALAVAGMFLAFAAADWVAANWLDGLRGATSFVLRGLTFAVFGAVAIYLTSARPIRRALSAQQEAVESYEAVLEERTDHHRLTGRLQSALDMAESDLDAFDVVARAMDAVAEGPAELLLADSSRAHLRRVAVAPHRGGPACSVETPWSCPAVRRGRTMVFADSGELDACPRLRDRPAGPCSSLCVPVTVLGTPMGVIHTTAGLDDPPEPAERSALEAIAEQAGSRIGVLRAMATSELQATTDPLTGLLNRRSLEEQLGELADRGARFTVAFCDLDHFKRLNDTHGHEAGDRALRCFARLLRSAVRDTDIVCRYGGEEFVVLFPDTDAAQAEPVMGRLAEALETAVLAGEVPELTVSVGIADWTTASEPTEAIRQADGAMFQAKQAGRDQIVRALLTHPLTTVDGVLSGLDR
jgi:diguanylate cyclase (GGDEF)-like protein